VEVEQRAEQAMVVRTPGSSKRWSSTRMRRERTETVSDTVRKTRVDVEDGRG
jgi:hypothetical protein